LVIGYIAMQNKDALTRWELFPQEKLDIWLKIPVPENFAQTDMQKKAKKPHRKRVVLDESGMVASSANLSFPLAAPVPAGRDGSKSAPGERYVIRFAVCLFKYSAESIKKELGAKGVESVIRLGKRKMPFYRLKIGPFPDSIARKKVRGILKEMSIPVSPPSSAEDKAITTAAVWSKNKTTKAQKRLAAMSIGVEMLTGKKVKAVFKVTSSYFDDHSVAARRLKEWRKKKIGGVVEKVDS